MSGAIITRIIQSIGQIGIFAAGSAWGVYFQARIGDPILDVLTGAWPVWLMVFVFGLMVNIVIGDKPNA